MDTSRSMWIGNGAVIMNDRPGMSHSDGSSRPRPRLHRQRLPQRLGAAHEACVQRAALDIAAPRETGSVSATPPAPFGQFAATKALAASISGRDVSADAVSSTTWP